MPMGQCKLCLNTRELIRSHFLPAALYKMSRLEGVPNPNPTLLTARGVVQTSRQMWAHILCRECERLFDENGERYAMSMVNRAGTFPLLAVLNAVRPSKSAAGFDWYDQVVVPDIDRAKLGYFALSVFWRAAVYNWHKATQKEPSVLLGPYLEPIRTYLLGETAFPKEILVMLFVCTDQISHNVFYEPTRGNEADPTSCTFQTRGLNFLLTTSKAKPERIVELCMVTGADKWIVTRSCAETLLETANRIRSRNAPSRI